jgi:hypothetical protein
MSIDEKKIKSGALLDKKEDCEHLVCFSRLKCQEILPQLAHYLSLTLRQ